MLCGSLSGGPQELCGPLAPHRLQPTLPQCGISNWLAWAGVAWPLSEHHRSELLQLMLSINTWQL